MRRVPYVVGDMAAVPGSVTVLRHMVVAFAAAHGAEGKLVGDIALAVSEAVANAVRHAYDEGDDGELHLAADVEEGILEIVIADDGHGIREGASGGLGMGLGVIADVCADFAIRERSPRGTEIWMRFHLGD
jgi:serine/threonine-protein kinase RsbW